MKTVELFIVTIEKDSDGTFVAYNTEESDFSMMGRGDTVAEAKEDFKNSMEEARASLVKNGREVPAAFDTEPQFHFDLSSLFDYYTMLNVSAFARYVGINDSLMRQYKKGNTYVSESQLQKIEAGIHKLGNEFSRPSII